MKKVVFLALLLVGCAQLKTYPERVESFKVPAGNVEVAIPEGYVSDCETPVVRETLTTLAVKESEYLGCYWYERGFEEAKTIMYVSLPDRSKASYVTVDFFEKFRSAFVNGVTDLQVLKRSEEKTKREFERAIGFGVSSYRFYYKGYLVDEQDRFMLMFGQEGFYEKGGIATRVERISGVGFYLADGSIVESGFATVVSSGNNYESVLGDAKHLMVSLRVSQINP